MPVDHRPTEAEQEQIAYLLERFRFEFVSVRLTDTMLDKSIIDARGPLQTLLRRTGLVDYASIGQGQDHKLAFRLPAVIRGVLQPRLTTFYRPLSKKGDPRVWVERLAAEADGGSLLLFAFSDDRVFVVVLDSPIERIADAVAEVIPQRFEERGELERSVGFLMERLAGIEGQWVRTMRAGPTGVGFTLESLLDIAANASPLADLGDVELKAYRRGARSGPGKLISLFAKTPEWVRGIDRNTIVHEYGYVDSETGRKQLYCTITSKPNTLGWRLVIEPDLERVALLVNSERVATYSLRVLEKRLLEKHPATLFIQVSTRGAGPEEEFKYEDVVLCRQPSLANFMDLIADDAVGLDLTLSVRPDGSTRDHGFLWRIRESRLADLYAYRRALKRSS